MSWDQKKKEIESKPQCVAKQGCISPESGSRVNGQIQLATNLALK
jgi:hypothetical protein